MIHYMGLDFAVGSEGSRAVAVAVDRSARVVGHGSAAIGGVSAGADGVASIRPGEWVRAGSLALKDVFDQIPAKVRRMWGISLSGPHGWVALDPDLEPLGPVRISPTPLEDFLRWLAENPRERAHIYSVLSPKDYFRQVLSGALATDVTQAERLGLLERGKTRWSRERLAELDIPAAWLPPVFDSAVATGRISEEGIRRSGLPGGLWVVAGAASGAGSLISAGDLRSGLLLVTALDSRTIEIRGLAAGVAEIQLPAGVEALPAPIAGHQVIRAAVEIPAGEAGAGAAAAWAVKEAFDRLRGLSLPGFKPPERIIVDHRRTAPPWKEAVLAGAAPAELSPFAGAEDPGTALLAALAQGAFRTLDIFHRKLRESRVNS
jgi:carbohydrate kinase of FGGY family protein